MKENIERNEWTDYFQRFSARNMSRLTRLEVFGEFGAQEEEHGMLFKGIAINGRYSERPSIEIMLGGPETSRTGHLTHVIPEVQQITPKRDEYGRDEALEIISGNGDRNLLRFEPKATLASVASQAQST